MKKLLTGIVTLGLVAILVPSTFADQESEINSPNEGEFVKDHLILEASYVDEGLDSNDTVQWAVREGTCQAGVGTVLGNVDGHSDTYEWTNYHFLAEFDVSGFDSGEYCFIFNPKEDADETNQRLTREFWIVDGLVHGGGHILEDPSENGPSKRKDWYDISFGGAVAKVNSAYMGEWQINLHNVGIDEYDGAKFHGTEIVSMNLFSGNNISCTDAVNFKFNGTLNGEPGYQMIFRAGDNGSPNNTDTVRVELFNPGGARIYDTHWGSEFNDESSCVGTARTGLDTGNLTIQQ